MIDRTPEDRAWDAILDEWKAEGLEVPEAYQADARARLEGTLFFQARVLRIAVIDLGEALWDTPPMRAVNALANWIAPPSVQEAADALVAAILSFFNQKKEVTMKKYLEPSDLIDENGHYPPAARGVIGTSILVFSVAVWALAIYGGVTLFEDWREPLEAPEGNCK